MTMCWCRKVNPDNSLTNITSGYVAGNASLAKGATSAHATVLIHTPDGPAGTGNFQITVTTDSGQTVKEYDSNGNPAYGNNSASISAASTLAPYPDLQVTNAGRRPPRPGSSRGDHVTLSWDDANTGNGATRGSWYDSITVTNSTTGAGPRHIGLASTTRRPPATARSPPATSRARQFCADPAGRGAGVGQIQFSVTTNVYNQVFEYNTSGPGGTSTAESNNTSSLTVSSTLAPYPDLTVPSLAVSPSSGLESGEQPLDPVERREYRERPGQRPVRRSRRHPRTRPPAKTLGTQDVAYDPDRQRQRADRGRPGAAPGSSPSRCPRARPAPARSSSR